LSQSEFDNFYETSYELMNMMVAFKSKIN
jgi:hypothetical protein